MPFDSSTWCKKVQKKRIQKLLKVKCQHKPRTSYVRWNICMKNDVSGDLQQKNNQAHDSNVAPRSVVLASHWSGSEADLPLLLYRAHSTGTASGPFLDSALKTNPFINEGDYSVQPLSQKPSIRGAFPHSQGQRCPPPWATDLHIWGRNSAPWL